MSDQNQATTPQLVNYVPFSGLFITMSSRKLFLCCLCSFFSFNYSLLRNLKDALVINAVGSPGAQIIPYLKF